MRQFADRQVGKQFNKWGMYRASLPGLWRRSDGAGSGGTWFCSELAAATLQAGGVIGLHDAGRVSPNALHKICSGKRGLNCALTVNKGIMSRSKAALTVLKQSRYGQTEPRPGRP